MEGEGDQRGGGGLGRREEFCQLGKHKEVMWSPMHQQQGGVMSRTSDPQGRGTHTPCTSVTWLLSFLLRLKTVSGFWSFRSTIKPFVGVVMC